MKQVDMDRETLKRLVESYGKEDVKNFVFYINESRDDDLNAVQECVRKISEITGGLKEDILNKIQEVLEDLVDTVQNEPYELGRTDGRAEVEDDFDEQLDEARRIAYDNGKKNGYYNGYMHATGRMKRALQSIRDRGIFGNRISITRAIDLVDDVAVNVEDDE